MKPPVPDDRQTLEELRRIFDADELPVPDRLRPDNLLPTLLAEKPALPIYRQRWFRPAIATAAAAAVVLLLVCRFGIASPHLPRASPRTSHAGPPSRQTRRKKR